MTPRAEVIALGALPKHPAFRQMYIRFPLIGQDAAGTTHRHACHAFPANSRNSGTAPASTRSTNTVSCRNKRMMNHVSHAAQGGPMYRYSKSVYAFRRPGTKVPYAYRSSTHEARSNRKGWQTRPTCNGNPHKAKSSLAIPPNVVLVAIL